MFGEINLQFSSRQEDRQRALRPWGLGARPPQGPGPMRSLCMPGASSAAHNQWQASTSTPSPYQLRSAASNVTTQAPNARWAAREQCGR